jgi:hypothetical protein
MLLLTVLSARCCRQGKRGIEKPPFQLPEYIANTGITKLRNAALEMDEKKKLKSKTRDRVAPKMGRIEIDYQVGMCGCVFVRARACVSVSVYVYVCATTASLDLVPVACRNRRRSLRNALFAVRFCTTRSSSSRRSRRCRDRETCTSSCT